MSRSGGITVKTFFRPDGQRTCAEDFRDGRVCALLRLARQGTEEHCAAVDPAKSMLHRGDGENGPGTGYLIPHDDCPITID